MKPVINDRALTIGQQSWPLPELAQPATVRVYRVPEDYREDGIFVSVQAAGQPQELPACAAQDATLLATLELPASEAAQLQAAKAERLSMINREADQLLARLAADCPEREVLSWDQQLLEAQDDTSPRPLLTAMAAARGIELDDLVQRVLAKAQLYAMASGAILGARQKLEDTLEQADTLDALHQLPSLQEALNGAA